MHPQQLIAAPDAAITQEKERETWSLISGSGEPRQEEVHFTRIVLDPAKLYLPGRKKGGQYAA
jgi:hypothetical protein